MATSRPNQIRYNDKISKLRVEIGREKTNFIEAVQRDIQSMLERRSPVDIGDLKKSWRVVITNKHKLAGHSLADLNKSRPISLGISIESTSRHAIMQMFGWTAVRGQLLTGYKKSGKWRILRASRPMFGVNGESERHRKPKRARGKIRTFVTKGGVNKPNSNLAFEGGSHSVKTEIKRIIARRLKECKYLGSVTFMSDDVAKVWTGNKAVGRIAQWMQGTLSVELNSTATFGLKQRK